MIDEIHLTSSKTSLESYSNDPRGTIKSVFEEYCAHVVADKHLANTLQRLQLGFVHKNADHIEFFGGNLTGVNMVRFLGEDSDNWFNNVLELSEAAVKDPLHSLSTINPTFHISSSPLNLSVVWIVHLIQHSTRLTDKQKKEAQINALLYLQFKFFCSLLYHYFKFPADPETARATYATLTNKFTLKTQGSWLAVFRKRAEDILSDTSPHYDAIVRMDSDKDVVDMLNDVQGRLRDMLKNIYAVMMRVHNAGERIHSQSSVVEHDGVSILKDRTRGLGIYSNYIKATITDKNSFIRDELLQVSESVVPTAPPKLVHQTLMFMSENYLKRGDRKIDILLDDVLIHAFGYLLEIQGSLKAGINLAGLLERLRGIYTSSRSSDPELLALRERTEELVRKAVDTKTAATIASVRTAVLLYIVARTFTMRHYTSGG